MALSNSLPCGLRTIGLAWLLALLVLAGCDDSPQAPVVTQPAAPEIVPEVASEASDPPTPVLAGPILPPAEETKAIEPIAEPSDGSRVIEETWDAYSLHGNRVGYAHTTVAKVVEGGKLLHRTRSATRTSFQRAGQSIVQDMLATSWETPEGEVVRFESRMKMGPQDMVSTGRVADGKMTIETTTVGKTQKHAIDWPAGTGGFFAVEQSLENQPLKPGEKRRLSCLMPVFNTIGTSELTAADYETVKLPSGEKKLLKVDSVVEIGGQKLDTTLWLDDEGQVLRSLVPAIGQEALRTKKEDALQSPAAGGFDLLAASIVKLRGELRSPLTTERVVYRATVKTGELKGVFPESLSQRVKLIDERTAEVTVLAVRPDVPEADNIQLSKPTDGDLAANNLIQSDDPRIVAMAEKAAPPSDDAWATAVALEKHVAQSIQKKNFSQAFATAGEVAQSLEGDCTEHAVLLAALCRARKIPARVAFGLVYYPPERGFAYHMWNEVWIKDRWIPLDGTLGLGGIGADHIKLGDSNLSGGSGLAAMLPVMQVFGRLELEVLTAE
jgi:hypothetical protein